MRWSDRSGGMCTRMCDWPSLCRRATLAGARHSDALCSGIAGVFRNELESVQILAQVRMPR